MTATAYLALIVKCIQYTVYHTVCTQVYSQLYALARIVECLKTLFSRGRQNILTHLCILPVFPLGRCLGPYRLQVQVAAGTAIFKFIKMFEIQNSLNESLSIAFYWNAYLKQDLKRSDAMLLTLRSSEMLDFLIKIRISCKMF